MAKGAEHCSHMSWPSATKKCQSKLPTKSAHPTYKNCPSDLRKMFIRPTKNAHPTSKSAHPTYEKCPSDLQKMPIRPTKNAHPTYEKCTSYLYNEKCPSDLQKRPIRPYNLSKRQLKVGRTHEYAVLNVPIRPTVHRPTTAVKTTCL